MTPINARQPGRGHARAVQEAYEFYLIDGMGGRRFEPFACEGAIELMRAVRARLAGDEGLIAIEVRQGSRMLFTLER